MYKVIRTVSSMDEIKEGERVRILSISDKSIHVSAGAPMEYWIGAILERKSNENLCLIEAKVRHPYIDTAGSIGFWLGEDLFKAEVIEPIKQSPPLKVVKHKQGSAKAVINKVWGKYPEGEIIFKSVFFLNCCDVKTFDFENYGRRLREMNESGEINYDTNETDKSIPKGRIKKLA